MRLKAVAARNFHGLNFALTLGPVNLITGSNFAGKTAVVKAIRLGLTGKLPPPIGVNGIYKLAGNFEKEGSMAIHLGTDTGRAIDLEWKKNSEGSVRASGTVPIDLRMPELLCEPRQFFALTGQQRVQAVFNACPLDETQFGPDKIKKAILTGVAESTPLQGSETFVQNILDHVSTLWNTANPFKTTLQSKCEALIAWLKDQEGRAKRTSEGLSSELIGLRLAVAGNPTSKNRSEEIAAVEKELSAQPAGNQEFEVALRTAQRRLNDLGITGMYAEEVEKALDVCHAQLQEYADWKPTVDVSELKAKKEALASLGDTLKECVKARLQAESELEATLRLKETVSKLKLCAKCKKALGGNYKTKISSLNAAIKQKEEARATVAARHDSADTELRKGYEAMSSDQRRKATLDTAIKACYERIQSIQATYEEYRRANKALRERPDAPDRAGLQSQLTALKVDQAAYEAYQRNITMRNEKEKLYFDAQREQQVMHRAVASMLTEQKRIMESAFQEVLKVANAFTDGILNSNLEFCDGELGRRVTQLDKSSGNTSPEGSWISVDSFSGTEEALAMMGFGVALCQKAPIKLVTFDELGRVSEENKQAVLGRMTELAANGTVDQVILVDTDWSWVEGMAEADGLKIIELNPAPVHIG